MAKGFKLKELLKNQKEGAKYQKEQEAKQNKLKEKLQNEEVVVVDAETVAAKDAEKAAADEQKATEDASKDDSESYESQTLSKKAKRQLKKQEKKLNLQKLEHSDSESEIENEDEDDKIEENKKGEENEEEQEEEQEEEEDVPLSEVEFDSDADIVPHSKLTINNGKALKHCLERVQLPWSKHSFEEHQSVISANNTDSTIKDIYDDTERELAFYKQSLDAVTIAHEKLNKLKIPFLRPLDYFAEMVKTDEHMDKIKGKLLTEISEKKAREDARKQRNLKKFGKQVQVATLQKRQLEKRDTLDKIKNLKKKRQNNEINDSEFDVGIEDAAEAESRYQRHKPSAKRSAKNDKYGKGGMKRFKRKNDADSAADVSGFNSRRGGKGHKRSRRH